MSSGVINASICGTDNENNLYFNRTKVHTGSHSCFSRHFQTFSPRRVYFTPAMTLKSFCFLQQKYINDENKKHQLVSKEIVLKFFRHFQTFPDKIEKQSFSDFEYMIFFILILSNSIFVMRCFREYTLLLK